MNEQGNLFGSFSEDGEDDWIGMPEFYQEDMRPWHQINVRFRDQKDFDEFMEKMEQKITPKQKTIWFPYKPFRRAAKYQYLVNETINPNYPIYIVSKGRWETRHTSKVLEKMNIFYRIVVESHEYDNYASVIDPEKILVLPKKYLNEYDTCDDLGSSKSKGPGAARNFCWDHSIGLGTKRHWVMDDNIASFNRLNRNLMCKVTSAAIFRATEDFIDRYENIYIWI